MTLGIGLRRVADAGGDVRQFNIGADHTGFRGVEYGADQIRIRNLGHHRGNRDDGEQYRRSGRGEKIYKPRFYLHGYSPLYAQILQLVSLHSKEILVRCMLANSIGTDR